MKNLKTIFGSLLLVIMLTGTALAGEMETPYAPTNSPSEISAQSEAPTLTQVTTQILIDYLMLVF